MKPGQFADFDVSALYAAMEAQRQYRGLSWTQVARELSNSKANFSARGVSPSTLSGMRKRRGIEGDGVLQMLRWLRRTPESFVPGYDKQTLQNAALPEVGPNRVLRFDTRSIYKALQARRIERGMTWEEVADDVGGCKPAQLKHLSEGGRTWFPLVMRIVRWLGRTAASFTRISLR